MLGKWLWASFGAALLFAGLVYAQNSPEAAPAPAPMAEGEAVDAPSEGEPAPAPVASKPAPEPPKDLLKNGDFAEWEVYAPVGWKCVFGTEVKQAEEKLEGHPVIQIDPMEGKVRQMDQSLRGLEKQIHGGDTIRFEAQMRCEDTEKANLFISRAYEVSGKMSYKLERQYVQGDGKWHSIVLEKKFDARELTEPSALLEIGIGIRGETDSLKPIYVSNAKITLEREESPPDENVPLADSAHLLKNADFSAWGEKGPADWNVGSGLTAKKTEEKDGDKGAVGIDPIPGRTNAQIYQYLSGLANFARPGDLVHVEMRVKCENSSQVSLFLELGYDVDGDLRWASLTNACPADGAWHTVGVDWAVSKDHIPENPKLRAVRGGIRVEGATPTPFFVSGARAWVVSTGL